MCTNCLDLEKHARIDKFFVVVFFVFCFVFYKSSSQVIRAEYKKGELQTNTMLYSCCLQPRYLEDLASD